MIRTSAGLWQIHTILADYVMPTKKLCQALANNSADEALVRDLLAKIQLDPKKRKKLEKAKNYHWFGLACIKSENPATQLNPLKANWHHRCVRHADEFNRQIQSLQTSDTADLDLVRARLIARQLKHVLRAFRTGGAGS